MPRRYAYCPNLTIIDTPGFILQAKDGEAARTPDDILAMVKAQAAPVHRYWLVHGIFRRASVGVRNSQNV
jgi:hypothetical protein